MPADTAQAIRAGRYCHPELDSGSVFKMLNQVQHDSYQSMSASPCTVFFTVTEVSFRLFTAF